MKVNIYKIINKDKLEKEFEKNDYKKIGNNISDGFNYSLYIKKKKRDSIDWVNELKKVFKLEEEFDYGFIYNGVLFVETTKNFYGISYGHAFHLLQKNCDYNFALDFAERELKLDKIELKNSSFIQSIKIKELTNYKKDSLSYNEGGEVYKFLSGEPIHGNVFGKKIDCGFSIQFSKSIKFEGTKPLNELNTLIKEVESVMKVKTLNTFPRIRYINLREDESIELDRLLLDNFLKSTSNNIEINLSAFDVIGNKIYFNTSQYKYVLYLSVDKKATSETIDNLNIDNIREYILNKNDKITKIDDICIELVDEENEVFIRNLKQIIFAEIKKDKKTFVLDNGLWGEYNIKFLEELDKRLEDISNKKMEIAPVIYQLPYKDEDDYIDKIIENERFVKLHKNLIFLTNQKVELADLYDKENQELISVKFGSSKKIQDLIYSFDQAITSIKGVVNSQEFNVKDSLLKYGIDEKIIDEILNSKKNSVLMGLEQKTYKKSISNNTFSLKKLRSLLLKLKIVSWANYAQDINIDFKLYVIKGK